jgi:hypothetical protein
VLLELERQDDDVFAWAKRHVTFMPLEDEIRAATEILAKFSAVGEYASEQIRR